MSEPKRIADLITDIAAIRMLLSEYVGMEIGPESELLRTILNASFTLQHKLTTKHQMEKNQNDEKV